MAAQLLKIFIKSISLAISKKLKFTYNLNHLNEHYEVKKDEGPISSGISQMKNEIQELKNACLSLLLSWHGMTL